MARGQSCFGRNAIVASSPYCWRNDNPLKSLSLKMLKGPAPLGTLTVISIISLNFQALGVDWGASVTTMTLFEDSPVARVDDVVVTLGEEIEPIEVFAVEMVTPFTEREACFVEKIIKL